MNMQTSAEISKAQQHANTHYENFPVASLLLPKKFRKPVAIVYTFARQADDFADEGNDSDQERLAKLDQFDSQLLMIQNNQTPTEPLFVAIAEICTIHNLSVQLFRDLLSAFKQDVEKKRFKNRADVLDYCVYSANPVGRILLQLYQHDNTNNLIDSDKICSALQLINFLQDIQQDYHELDRIYLPQDRMQVHGVTEKHFIDKIADSGMQQLIREEIEHAYQLLSEGAPLAWRLPGRIGMELRLIVAGGFRTLQRLSEQSEFVFNRPRLKKSDWIWMLPYALKIRKPTHLTYKKT